MQAVFSILSFVLGIIIFLVGKDTFGEEAGWAMMVTFCIGMIYGIIQLIVYEFKD